ncbi:hypothetical protein [Corynebacterium ammoniagenes]|uniref:Uncharacterized protein n=1 Tax=Corynebacterium ammoniagenes DSM 20306 TaxID=649754 RepID=A0ABP2IBR9_CORAM|nr:hypothetical protein [Corynebacterium ammoniagenes]APT81879.1 hypothetical protein CAMM_02725 [Corynebacterium ammoniagenes DSM 20306]AQS72996.1 hypothetical protein CA40472_03055 [Corynebacterium ammoniagenes]EFG80958.1 hypothetical protein HMPREF0281_01832 [Corynebacterium ammoniagenes DSM 20306]NMF32689.1 hypothetical protein [Corynebacterium ammoniagenes]
MATKKSKIEIALERIESEKRAREEAKRREKEQQDKLNQELGRVLSDAAAKPDSEWAEYRDHTVAELLTALGLEVVGKPTSEAPRGESEPAGVQPPAGDSGQSTDWPD